MTLLLCFVCFFGGAFFGAMLPIVLFCEKMETLKNDEGETK